jgi:hypothetical protein
VHIVIISDSWLYIYGMGAAFLATVKVMIMSNLANLQISSDPACKH